MRIYKGYKAFNGHIFSENDCNVYNNVCSKIESYKHRDIEVPEYLLDEAHRCFTVIVYQNS